MLKPENRCFTELADRYDAWFDINDKLYDSEVAAIKGFADPPENAIEIGVGTGRFASVLGIKKGVDLSDEMAGKARERGIDVLIADAESMPFADSSFRLALMVTVDCFLSDTRAAFREANRILTGDGAFVVAFLNRETPLGRLYEKNKASNEFYRDARFCSAEEIKLELRQTGFEIKEECQTVFTLENRFQPYKKGTGEGVFTVFKAAKTLPPVPSLPRLF